MRQILMLLMLCMVAFNAYAHKPSDSYLSLNVANNVIEGQWDIALRDLDFAIGLDTDGDAQITWGEVKAKRKDIDAYVMSRLQLWSDNADCPARLRNHLIDDHTDGAYVVIQFVATCPADVQRLDATYRLFFDLDPQHKGLLRLQFKGATTTAIFSPDKSTQQFSLAQPQRLQQFLDYVREGVWHIWIGFDHILFLLALLLPAVQIRAGHRWQGVAAFKPALLSVLKIVTAFTLAHSITLSLATLGIIGLPSRLVESIIAASVVLAALNNLFPLFSERRWLMAFVFGLIHGFGFASVLTDLGLPQGALALSLVGFNVGVELGQLAIVAAFLPVAYALRKTWFYRRVILVGGSGLIALLALGWLVERAFDLKFM